MSSARKHTFWIIRYDGFGVHGTCKTFVLHHWVCGLTLSPHKPYPGDNRIAEIGDAPAPRQPLISRKGLVTGDGNRQ
jgi:hypothetical protein